MPVPSSLAIQPGSNGIMVWCAQLCLGSDLYVGTKCKFQLMLLQVEKTQQAVKKEQSLASKLKDEIKAVSSSTDKQMQLEQQKVQATEKERALTEKALQAERQKVSCMTDTSAPDVNFVNPCPIVSKPA